MGPNTFFLFLYDNIQYKKAILKLAFKHVTSTVFWPLSMYITLTYNLQTKLSYSKLLMQAKLI